jgi:hypothetical protein
MTNIDGLPSPALNHPEDFEVETLNKYRGSVCVVDAELRISYVNPAWHRFAKQNGGGPDFSDRWSQGASILDAMQEPIRRYFEQVFEGCLRTRKPFAHDYECSSADLKRLMHAEVLPLRSGRGLLMVHSQRVEEPHTGLLPETETFRYHDADGIAHQCGHCRRMRRSTDDGNELWDWVPSYVSQPPATLSHGLCPICLEYYYPASR